MAQKPIQINSRPISVHKATVKPKFNEKTVLVEDTWEYVEMWLKREHASKNALYYWNQAQYFFNASRTLPKMASPLTAYYCFLNATKALLVVNGITFSDKHGVSGKAIGKKTALMNEIVSFNTGGVLAALCRFLDEPTTQVDYNLKDILYNLPYIHRAYNLTFENQPELFIPIEFPHFVKKINSHRAWFCSEIIDRKYKNQKTLDKLPNGYGRDLGRKEKWIIRRSARFTYTSAKADKNLNLQRLTNYHKITRKTVHYIYGNNKLWYIKRDGVANLIDRSPLTLTFAAMHRLSELARYSPISLAKHFDSQHNWLLSEFINIALYQFMDAVSSELTGNEFMVPGRRSHK